MGERDAVNERMRPALAILELDSIAVGIDAGDAMAKRAAVETLLAGTVHPGKYLVLVAGGVAEVEESFAAGEERAVGHVVDRVILRDVHPGVVAALEGTRLEEDVEALGVVETASVAATVEAADAGMKGARVDLLEIRLADGLGGKGYLLFGGPVSEVEAAVEIGAACIASGTAATLRVIPRLDPRMRRNLAAGPRFHGRIQQSAGSPDGAGEG